MQLERSKNAKRNIFFGFFNKMVMLMFPFIIQSVVIQVLGVGYLGIKGLFTSILQVMNLAELGFGTAMVYAMYKPIAQDDRENVCALLNYYKTIYRWIGGVVLVVGMAIMPFLSHFIKDECPADINLYLVYFMYLINTVLSYWLYAYKSALLNAFQRVDVLSIISTITQTAMYIAQIVLLIFLKNYYVYLGVAILATIANNFLTSWNVDRLYPQYKCVGNISLQQKRDIKKKVSGLMLYKLCSTTRNAFDSIFLSMFLGLTLTAMYNNYFMILTGLITLMSIVTSAIVAGVGNSIELDSVEKNYKDMEKVNFLYMLLSGWCTICLVCLYQPFMEIWMGKEMVFSFPVAILFSVYFYILKMGDIRGVYADAAGLWWENRYRTLAEAIVNIILNYILVKLMGVYGIIIATIFSLFFLGFIGSTLVLFKNYFKFGIKRFLGMHLVYFGVTVGNCLITYLLGSKITGENWKVLFVRAFFCITVSTVIYFLIYRRTRIYKESIEWLKEKVKYS